MKEEKVSLNLCRRYLGINHCANADRSTYNTFIPNVLEIGGFTSGMFKTGTACLLECSSY